MNTLSAAQRKKWRLAERQGFLCHWCSKPVFILAGPVKNIPKNAATEDHVYPRGDYRRQELQHSTVVITKVIACRGCNQQRGNMAYDDFLKLKRPEWAEEGRP